MGRHEPQGLVVVTDSIKRLEELSNSNKNRADVEKCWGEVLEGWGVLENHYKEFEKNVIVLRSDEPFKEQLIKQHYRPIVLLSTQSLVDKDIQAKVKKLGHSTFATIEQNKYMVVGYKGFPQLRFDTLEELNNWTDDELIKLEIRREEIRSKGYKYLKIEGKNGQVTYYHHLNFIFTKFKIRCKSYKGDINEIPENELLNKDDVPEMKIEIAR